MAVANQCGLFPQAIYEQWIRPPYEEGRLQFAYAFFQNNSEVGEPPSLVERVVHFTVATTLIIPIVNWVVYLAMQYFHWTISKCFQSAVASGDSRLVLLYLNLGIDPKQYGNELLYQTDDRDVIRALLSHGISPYALSIRNETFPEYLIREDKEDFLKELVQEKYIDVSTLLTQEMFLKAQAEGNESFLKFLIEMGYEGSGNHFVGLNLQVGPENSLIRAAFNHDRGVIDHLARTQSFQEFCVNYTALKKEFPHICTDWMWNALFRIPQRHFDSFRDVSGATRDVSGATEVIGSPPTLVSLDTMLNLFDRINFDNPHGDHYISEDQCKETLGTVLSIRSPGYLRQGLCNIIEKIKGAKQDETGANMIEMENHRRYLEWVIYYLGLNETYSAEPLDRTKAQVLIDMGKAGQVCSGRWKELFYECRCRLSEEKIEERTFEEQVMAHLGALRSMVLYQIVHTQAQGCPHARDNLMFYLKAMRRIPGDSPTSVYNHEGIKFREFDEAQRAFDSLYTPSSQIAHIGEQVRATGQKAKDFGNLAGDFMTDHFASRLQVDSLLRMRSALGGLAAARMSYAGIEEFFQGFDPEYVVTREALTIEGFNSRLTKDSLLAPLGSFFDWPKVEDMSLACTADIAEKRRQMDALITLFLEQASDYDRLKQEKEVAVASFNEAKKGLEDRLKQEKVFSRYETLRPSIESGSASFEDQKEFDALIMQYAPGNYIQLQHQADQTQEDFGKLCMQARSNMQKASQEKLRQAKGILGIPPETLLSGPQLFMQHYLRLGRELSALESGHMDAKAIKRTFQDQAENFMVKQNSTLREFMASRAFQELRTQLGDPFITQALPGVEAFLDQRLSHPAVKKAIAGCVAEIALSIAPKPPIEYFNRYQKELFMHLVRPLDEQTGACAIPEGIQPLAMGVLLVNLGHLEWCNREYFCYSFLDF